MSLFSINRTINSSVSCLNTSTIINSKEIMSLCIFSYSSSYSESSFYINLISFDFYFRFIIINLCNDSCRSSLVLYSKLNLFWKLCDSRTHISCSILYCLTNLSWKLRHSRFECIAANCSLYPSFSYSKS